MWHPSLTSWPETMARGRSASARSRAVKYITAHGSSDSLPPHASITSRYLSALYWQAPGERRGDSVTTGNGVEWVDDFIFYKLVREHAACAGIEGGWPVCLEYLPQAEAVDAFWVQLCWKGSVTCLSGRCRGNAGCRCRIRGGRESSCPRPGTRSRQPLPLESES